MLSQALAVVSAVVRVTTALSLTLYTLLAVGVRGVRGVVSGWQASPLPYPPDNKPESQNTYLDTSAYLCAASMLQTCDLTY